MAGLYDDAIENVSEMLSEAILKREDGLDALEVDADVHVPLRDVGLRTTHEVVDAVAEQAVQSAKAQRFIVIRRAEAALAACTTNSGCRRPSRWPVLFGIQTA